MSSWVRDKQLYESQSGSKGSIRSTPQSRPPPRSPIQDSPRPERPKATSPLPSPVPKPIRKPVEDVQIPIGKGEDMGSVGKFSSVDVKRTELNFKRFANRMELMTKKALQDYFHLNELQGSQIVDRLFFAFGKTNSIDLSSFLATISLLATASAGDRARFLFRLLDVKGTGIVDRNEMKRVMLSLLNAALIVDVESERVAEVQEEVRGESAQEIEQAVEELVDDVIRTHGSHGSFLTAEEFIQWVLSDPLIARALSI